MPKVYADGNLRYGVIGAGIQGESHIQCVVIGLQGLNIQTSCSGAAKSFGRTLCRWSLAPRKPTVCRSRSR